MSTIVVIYPQFEECCRYILDDYWKDVFLNCACNRFPKGSRYDPNTNTVFVKIQISGNKTKNEMVELPSEPEEISTVLLKIFREDLGMYSVYDLKIKRQELEKIREQRKINIDCEWKQLKPRSVKDVILLNFIAEMKNKYNLTKKETRKLYGTINFGFQNKTLVSEDVNYSNKKIQSIRGLEFLSDERRWVITNTPQKISKIDKSSSTQRFNQNIDKFIRDYKSNKFSV